MLKVTKVVMDFMKDVMEELSTRAHKENEKSNEDLRKLMLKIKDVTNLPNCPVELKAMFSTMIGKVQGWTGIEL